MYLVILLPSGLVWYGAYGQNKTTHMVVDIVLKWLCLKLSIQVSQYKSVIQMCFLRQKHIKNATDMVCCLSTDSNMFPVGGKSVMSHESQLTNSLARKTTNETFDLLMIKTNLQICVPVGIKGIFFTICSSFELGGTCISTHFNKDWPHGKQAVLFPLDPQCSP